MNESENLAAILNRFNAASLADGDLTSGTNVLATMCFTLTNLLPRGSGWQFPNGDFLQVGQNFLMLDGFSSSLADAKVFNPMAVSQANLTANIKDGSDYDAYYCVSRNLQGLPVNPPPLSDIPMAELRNHLGEWAEMFMRGGDGPPFDILLDQPPRDVMSELKKCPLVFTRMDSTSPPLEKLPLPNRDQLYIRGFLDASPAGDSFLSRLRSTAQGGGANPALQTRMALSSSLLGFKKMFMGSETDFLSKFLWLLDHPKLSVSSDASTDKQAIAIQKQFDAALRRAWKRRLNPEQALKMPLKEKLYQEQWIRYLDERESRFPGIKAAAHPLFGTLLFGLTLMRPPQTPQIPHNQVLSMAKALIERMIFFRERLLQTEELHRMQHIAIRMLKKLGGSPLTPREIVRKTNRLVISDCREALQLLQNVGVVSEVGCERWSLTMSPSEGAAKVRSSFVDV